MAKRAVPAEEARVAEQIQELPDETLWCRDLRHAWNEKEAPYRQVTVEGGVRGAIYLDRRVPCYRCPVQRVELYRVHDGWLERLSSYPKYPKTGYLLHDIPKGTNVVGMVRFEQYQRALRAIQAAQ